MYPHFDRPSKRVTGIERHDPVTRREGILLADPGLGSEIAVRDITPEIEENRSALWPPVLGVCDRHGETGSILQPDPLLSRCIAGERYRGQRLQGRQWSRLRIAHCDDPTRGSSCCVGDHLSGGRRADRRLEGIIPGQKRNSKGDVIADRERHRPRVGPAGMDRLTNVERVPPDPVFAGQREAERVHAARPAVVAQGKQQEGRAIAPAAPHDPPDLVARKPVDRQRIELAVEDPAQTIALPAGEVAPDRRPQDRRLAGPTSGRVVVHPAIEKLRPASVVAHFEPRQIGAVLRGDVRPQLPIRDAQENEPACFGARSTRAAGGQQPK